MHQEIYVIYDGECEFCKNCLTWTKRKLVLTAIPYQSADLSRFGLTINQCAQQLHVIEDGKAYRGIKAVIYLLRKRKNRVFAFILKVSGPLGDKGYKWVAANRSSVVVAAFNYLLIKANRTS